MLARQFGFHHLGRFAADYRLLFGELPGKPNGSGTWALAVAER